ncbi:hypothetical protein GRS96_17110 [Rathayibacter sp. VKM Ac-2803]|uniref:hypothetical protein n=1 Tax=unclassified Rathayibacter TaxID=2609250 RepID=UPI001356982E|nr:MULTISPECIES: hypothetical protein [unclassified Rathayibacter]MWV50992.1 hypothetical protein [Rathayibacter sp. VKM Ac-2803]MWV57481.1 hypothetical protein [Rathayibacter sp. VKM Ac-2754]
MSGSGDPALGDEIDSILNLGEGRVGETAGPEDVEQKLTPEEDAAIEKKLKGQD